MKKHVLGFMTGILMAVTVVGCSASNEGKETTAAVVESKDSAKEKGYVIGFSNSYNGNSYRMVTVIVRLWRGT